MSQQTGNALDVLKDEDGTIREMLAQLAESRDGSVEARADYGNLAKEIIRHVATREAALADVASVIEGMDGLADLSQQLASNADVRRPQISEVEHMSRGIQGINLNQGQDFDGPLRALSSTLEAEIAWDTSELIPRVEKALAGTESAEQLRSAKDVQRHAPTNLHPEGPRWYERAPIISRIITLYDRWRDFPKAAQSR